MSDAKSCDRCGRFYMDKSKEPDSQGRYLQGIILNGIKFGSFDADREFHKKIDLCNECCGELLSWLFDSQEINRSK